MSAFTKRQQAMATLSALKKERESWINHWRDLNDYLLPRRGRFLTTDRNNGLKVNQKIIDSTGTFAARTLSSGLMSGVTSPSRPWFRLGTADEDLNRSQAVRAWLSTTERDMRTVFNRSNLYNALPLTYLDLGVFGTHALGVVEDDEDVIRCYPMPVGSYCLSNNHRLVVDQLVREFSMTARQLVERFGEKRCSDAVRSAVKNNQGETWFDVIQVIGPNQEYDASRAHWKFKRYRSCYFEAAGSGETYLGEGGFDEFPALCPRWSTTGEDVYGHSPAMDVLGDVKGLQLLQKRKSMAIEKQVNPPLLAPGSMRNQAISMLPGGVTFGDEREGMKGVRPLHEVSFPIDGVMEDIREHQGRINKALFVDLFLMMANETRSNITATEIAQRQEEKMLMLGPVLERLNDELLGPLIDRTFRIMLRRGLIAPPPPELEGVELKIEYVSIMAQAQKMIGVAGVDRWLGTVGNLAQSDPTSFDAVDRDKVVEYYHDTLNVPPELLRDEKQVAAIRQGRAQAQQQAAAAEQLAQQAKGAQLLSQTDTRGQNALTDLIGLQTGVTA